MLRHWLQTSLNRILSHEPEVSVLLVQRQLWMSKPLIKREFRSPCRGPKRHCPFLIYLQSLGPHPPLMLVGTRHGYPSSQRVQDGQVGVGIWPGSCQWSRPQRLRAQIGKLNHLLRWQVGVLIIIVGLGIFFKFVFRQSANRCLGVQLPNITRSLRSSTKII